MLCQANFLFFFFPSCFVLVLFFYVCEKQFFWNVCFMVFFFFIPLLFFFWPRLLYLSCRACLKCCITYYITISSLFPIQFFFVLFCQGSFYSLTFLFFYLIPIRDTNVPLSFLALCLFSLSLSLHVSFSL